jgi:hypothetical protein
MALMLALWFSFWAIHIVQSDVDEELRIFPKVEKDEQVNEEGSTLTLDCIINEITLHGPTDPRWILPRSEVLKMISINLNSILNIIESYCYRVFPSSKRVRKVSLTRNTQTYNQENYKQ